MRYAKGPENSLSLGSCKHQHKNGGNASYNPLNIMRNQNTQVNIKKYANKLTD